MTVTELKGREQKQKTLCDEKGYPLFAPTRCFGCRKNIYEKVNGESFITGCPYCHTSFCD